MTTSLAGARTSVTRLESASGLDRWVTPIRRSVQKLMPPGPVRDMLHGVPLGHAAHPTLVQASLGCFVSAGVLDVVGGPESRAASRTLVAAGLLSAPPALITGWTDWSELHEQQQRVGLVHAASNVIGLGLYAVSLAARLRGRSGRGWGFAGLSVMSVGGFLGGHLSFRQASGANHVEDVPHLVRPGWQDLCAAGDLPTDIPVRRVLSGGGNDDVPLMVIRRETSVVVLADRCSHLSAPLHEGKLTDDGCVVCPWHGSTFSLADGSVRRGPATAPAPVFDVRELEGRLQVRLPGAG